MAMTWKEELKNKLVKKFGNKQGVALDKKYAEAFSVTYIDTFDVDEALNDIGFLEDVSVEKPLVLNFYITDTKAEYPLRLRVYKWERPAPLSDVLPMLENMDLKTFSENSYAVTLPSGKEIWISDLSIKYNRASFDLNKTRALFEDALINVFTGKAENDGFNRLVLSAELGWREIAIFRAYAKYLRQARFRFSQAYIEKALINNPGITRDLITLFYLLHDPAKYNKTKKLINAQEEKIIQALNNVPSLDEDKIIRRLIDLFKATMRTNYFQRTEDGKPKAYFSFKLKSADVPELPLPVPLYEIFVYSPRFEAIHLRNGKVARGGLRWSDRAEDFRTEVLGLMKAQTVKNAVIVPSGAKGGFVLKHSFKTREEFQAEGVHCYQSFIRGMLDITDNIKGKTIIHPPQVVCHDEDDPYLVVAADKGTATFSDIANAISQEYHFWLDDAFASGGSTGYDHKKMGITARGAWESIKRHFIELGIDVMTTESTVIGVGDMSGDVFGNGMLYCKKIKLVAAFDHRHIFIDPTPDPEVSYKERQRLFNLPTSSWEDYNPKLISTGGGVFKRSLKSIPLSAQMRKVLGVEDKELAPTELVRAILKAPVDLFFNGGIGTYVKSSTESNADVGDRSNDYCRINGNELRCKVVGEGGNLGFTQLGRVEYALKGGLINTDFIDNSAGVDCSDHEVNLKILLDREEKAGRMTLKKRNQVLASLTKEIAELVLRDNYNQALIMSFSAIRSASNLSLHQNYLNDLESDHIINRQVEFLPDDRAFIERKTLSLGLTRPELAVLLAYTKIFVKREILQSKLPEDTYLSQIVTSAFPPSLTKQFKHAMLEHPLHRDIIATQLSNKIINEMGITFVYRMVAETGASMSDVIRAYTLASESFKTTELRDLILSLNFKITVQAQYEMLYHIRTLIGLATRWFLYSKHINKNLASVIKHFSSDITKLEELIPVIMGGQTKEYLSKLTNEFADQGLPNNIAKRVATYRAIYTALNIIEVSAENKFDLTQTAKVYFSAGERVNLLWFRDQISRDTREGHWNVVARLTLRDELDIAQRTLAVAVMHTDRKERDPVKLVDKWLANNDVALRRWEKTLSLLVTSNTVDYTMFFIALRELTGMVTASLRN
jgi:glutamate dehydrogenase